MAIAEFEKLSSDTQRKYKIISAIAFNNGPSMNEIVELTGIPEPTVKRQLAFIRQDLQMDIRFVTEKKTKGRAGNYHIYAWGLLNRTEFELKYQNLLDRYER